MGEDLAANGFSLYKISKALNRVNKTMDTDEAKPRSTAYLPFVKDIMIIINRLLHQHHIKTIFRAASKIAFMLRSAEDAVLHKSHGVC